MFNNKSILITGGTGSFGKKFTDIILSNYRPKKLIVFSRDELKQFEMEKKISTKYKKNVRFFIGDVRDKDRLKMAFRGVDYVVHAAALKQVPAAEYNPLECIKTNIGGAENIIQAAIECSVKKVIALSTDKAVNPINLYGASKLASDKIFIAANNLSGKKGTRFSVVRYGNVIGSRGSVIEVFLSQLKKSKVLTITDKEMTRFWISLKEGVNFVIKSFIRMHGGEIFIPKIPSIKIIDLGKAMCPDPIFKIIGIRPGEKMHELLCSQDDSRYTIEFADHYVIKPSINFFDLNLDYKKNNNNEKGKFVKNNFLYSSNLNKKFLKKKEINKILND